MITTRSSSPPSISVVFVSYDSAKTIGTAIHSVERYLPGAEVIVVDNGSTDQTCSIIRDTNSTLLLEGHGNIGFGAGVNLGARAATGDLLFVLNPDAAIVHANLERLSDLARLSPIGIRGCLQRDEHRSRYLKYYEWGWRRELCWLIVQWFLVPREMNLHRPSSRLRKSRRWISGAAFVVGRGEFLDIGGFDEDIFMYCEDVDLSRRYRDRDAVLGTTDAIEVTHEGQGSAQGGHEQIQGWALLSFLEVVAKWSGPKDAERAASATLRLLNVISSVARCASRLPLIGQRAAAKARSAATVRASLLESAATPPRAGVYPRARASVTAAAQTSEDARAQ
ncbi:MAG TPA: glycosyltransferase [Solirubrobacteraceae bacterium]|nr:glycosyltransferase [Solirubrobacteraceae bacterium]